MLLLDLPHGAVVPTCELFGGMDLYNAQLRSPLLTYAFQQTTDHRLVDAAWYASSITRDNSAIERDGWYLFAEGSVLVIGHVSEMVEFRMQGRMLLRLWLDQCYQAPLEGADGLLRVSRKEACRTMLVRLEGVAATPMLACGESNGYREFRLMV